MARRPGRSAGWLVLLILIGGGYNLLVHLSEPQAPVERAVPTPGPSRQTEPASAPTVKPKLLYVAANSLNVRASPSVGSEVLLTASRGTQVLAVSQSNGWYEVQLSNGSTGWMSADYLSDVAPAAQAEIATQPTPVPTPTRQVDRGAAIKAIIAESLQYYSGSCPCPYNRDRGGRSCGARSAYSKPGGASPLCYPADVTEAMIANYLARH
jgi:SH3-like domain-containing protein